MENFAPDLPDIVGSLDVIGRVFAGEDRRPPLESRVTWYLALIAELLS